MVAALVAVLALTAIMSGCVSRWEDSVVSQAQDGTATASITVTAETTSREQHLDEYGLFYSTNYDAVADINGGDYSSNQQSYPIFVNPLPEGLRQIRKMSGVLIESGRKDTLSIAIPGSSLEQGKTYYLRFYTRGYYVENGSLTTREHIAQIQAFVAGGGLSDTMELYFLDDSGNVAEYVRDGDGGVTGDRSGSGWSYSEMANKLTLDGYSGAGLRGWDCGDLTIEVKGESDITGGSAGYEGIDMGGLLSSSLRVTGAAGASLNCVSEGAGIYLWGSRSSLLIDGGLSVEVHGRNSYGIYATGDLTVSGGPVVTARCVNGGGIVANGNLDVSGNAKMDANGGQSYGIYANNATVRGNAQIKAENSSYSSGLYVSGDLSITDTAKVDAVGSWAGIYGGSVDISSDAQITARGKSDDSAGIRGALVNISDRAQVAARGKYAGISADSTVEIRDGAVVRAICENSNTDGYTYFGIYGDNGVNISGGFVTAIAEGDAYGIGWAVDITGGVVNAPNGIYPADYTAHNAILNVGDSGDYNSPEVVGNPVVRGNVTLPSDWALSVNANESITVANGAVLTIPDGASVTVESGAAFKVENGGRLVVDGAFVNNGALTNGGTFTNNGVLTNDGSLSNNGTLVNSEAFTNNGSLTNGGALTNNGRLTNNGSYSGAGKVDGNGVFDGVAPVAKNPADNAGTGDDDDGTGADNNGTDTGNGGTGAGDGVIKAPVNGGTQTNTDDGTQIKPDGPVGKTDQATTAVKPLKTKIIKIKVGKRSLTVTWKKLAKSQKITKYQVRYQIKGKKSWKVKTVAASKGKLIIKKLKKGKKYRVQVRSYKTVKVNGKSKQLYSPWSTVKTSKKVK
jgi:hypothetical protein